MSLCPPFCVFLREWSLLRCFLHTCSHRLPSPSDSHPVFLTWAVPLRPSTCFLFPHLLILHSSPVLESFLLFACPWATALKPSINSQIFILHLDANANVIRTFHPSIIRYRSSCAWLQAAGASIPTDIGREAGWTVHQNLFFPISLEGHWPHWVIYTILSSYNIWISIAYHYLQP